MLGLPTPSLSELVPTVPVIIGWFVFNGLLLLLGAVLPGTLSFLAALLDAFNRCCCCCCCCCLT
jgi:hypothetical protein